MGRTQNLITGTSIAGSEIAEKVFLNPEKIKFGHFEEACRFVTS